MKWSFASVGLIILGLFGIVIIMLFNDITVSNEQDYYTLKYATEAAMLESVDAAYYRLTGKVKMSQEKFVENFTRRFTETSTFGQGNYNIEFYQIIEYPAKVSLRIVDRSGDYNIYMFAPDVETTSTNIVNELSAILDTEQLEIVKTPIVRAKPEPKPDPPRWLNPAYDDYDSNSYSSNNFWRYNWFNFYQPDSDTNTAGGTKSGYYEVTLNNGITEYLKTLRDANNYINSISGDGNGVVNYYDSSGAKREVGIVTGGSNEGIKTRSGVEVYPSSSKSSSNSRFARISR